MTDCTEMRLLIQADMDGELSAADAARVAAHLETCAGCTEVQAQLQALSGRLRREVPRHAASAALQAALRARIAAAGAPKTAVAPIARPQRMRPGLRTFLPFGGGFALAACLALLLLPQGGDLPEAVVADHIRALQPGHLMDVVSTNQHTVKPWFDGRLDFAPPVKDLKPLGFPLTGGRLDYFDHRPVAALVYQHGQHVIDLLIRPEGGILDRGAANGSRSGYNFRRWTDGGMTFWAVSDVSADDLAEFARLWQAD